MNAMVIGGSAEVDEESLVLGTWIDMFDESTQQWYAAKVVKVKEEENRVQVQFNGWGDRHNQWVEKVRCGAVGWGWMNVRVYVCPPIGASGFIRLCCMMCVTRLAQRCLACCAHFRPNLTGEMTGEEARWFLPPAEGSEARVLPSGDERVT